MLSNEKPLKWVFAGDSITHGAYHTYGQRDYVQIIEERVRYELGRSLDVFIKTAVSGWTTQEILSNIDWSILQFEPDIVSIMIGWNDAYRLSIDDFAVNYRKILGTLLEKTNARIILHTETPVIPGGEINRPEREKNIPEFLEMIKAIGDEYGLPVVDHYSEWVRAQQENPIRVHSWMNDAVHPNAYGHRALARLILIELNIWDDDSRCCGVVVP